MKLQIAWRNLWRHPRRTIVILSAVIVGVWSMVFYSAFLRGMIDEMVRNNIENLTGHVQVQAPGYFDNPVIDNLLRDPEPVRAAIEAVAPADAVWTARLRIGGVIRSSHGAVGATIAGVVPAEEAGISFVGRAVTEGAFLPDPGNGLVVGQALLDRLEARIGHRLVIDAQNAAGEVESRAFQIVGVFRAQIEATEKQYVFCNRATLQDMLGIGDAVSEFCIMVPRYEAADALAAELQARLPEATYRVLTWRDIVPFISAYLDSMWIYTMIWNIVIFVAMAFGLVNTILMAVFERVREFGLVRALGVTPGGVVASVVLETIMLLVVGIAVGSGAGWATIAALGHHGIDFSAFAAGSELFGMSRVIYPEAYPADFLRASGMVVILGLLISLYPAIKAARITPVQAMTHL